MAFGALKSSLEKYYNMATSSETPSVLSSIQKFASETGAAIDDKVASISQSFSAFTSTQKPVSEGDADTNDKVRAKL